MGYFKNELGLKMPRGKKYKTVTWKLKAVYKINKERIDQAMSEVNTKSARGKTNYQKFAQLVKERMYDIFEDSRTSESFVIKKMNLKESIESLAYSNYFTDQETRGSLAWSDAFKKNAKPVWNDFMKELQKGVHEKFDPTNWIYMEEESSKDQQLYAYVPKKKLKDGTAKSPIVISMRNSPEIWTKVDPPKDKKYELKDGKIVLVDMPKDEVELKNA